MSHAICTGRVYHRRMDQAKHAFSYSLYMLLVDLKDSTLEKCPSHFISTRRFAPIQFRESDYLLGQAGSTLAQRVKRKLQELGARETVDDIRLLTQGRCLGLYFSPVNFYFCYTRDESRCRYLLAEVSNTPWNERHYYLVDMNGSQVNEKSFHVSPFMEMTMDYHWQISPPDSSNDDIRVHIENHSPDKGKVFDATLSLKQMELTPASARRTFWRHPVMTLKIVSSIYFEALRLMLKRVRFVPYQSRKARREAQH